MLAGVAAQHVGVCEVESGVFQVHGFRFGGIAASQHRLHTQDELLRAERLRHVVVGAAAQPGETVVRFVFRREKDDGQGRIGVEGA